VSGGGCDVRGTPYPPYVISAEELRRWDWSTLLALGLSRAHSIDHPDNTFIWFTTRSIYENPVYEVGTEAEFEEDVVAAVEYGLIVPREVTGVES
jgi:hypothetical protein